MLCDNSDSTDDAQAELHSHVSALQRALEEVVLQTTPDDGGSGSEHRVPGSVLCIRPQYLVVATHACPAASTISTADDLQFASHPHAAPSTSVSERDAESARIVYGGLRSLAQQQRDRSRSVARRGAGMPRVAKGLEVEEPSALTASFVCSGGVAAALPLAFSVLKCAVLDAQHQQQLSTASGSFVPFSALGSMQLGSFPLRALSGIRVAAAGAALLCMLSDPMVGVMAALNAVGRNANQCIELRFATQPFFGFRARPPVHRESSASLSHTSLSMVGSNHQLVADDEDDDDNSECFPLAATAWYTNAALAHVLLMPSAEWLDLFPFELQDTALCVSRQLHEWYVDVAFPLRAFPSRTAEWKAFAELVESCFVDKSAQQEFYRSMVVLVLLAELELVNDVHIRPSSPTGWQLVRLLMWILDEEDECAAFHDTYNDGNDTETKAGVWLKALGTAPSPSNPRVRIVVREPEERYGALVEYAVQSIQTLLADVCGFRAGAGQGHARTVSSREEDTLLLSPTLFDQVSRVTVVLTGVHRGTAEDGKEETGTASMATIKASATVPAPHAFSAPAVRGSVRGSSRGLSQATGITADEPLRKSSAKTSADIAPGYPLLCSPIGAALPYFAVNAVADLATAVTVRSLRTQMTTTGSARRTTAPPVEAPLRCSFDVLQAVLPEGRPPSRNASSSSSSPNLLLSALVAVQHESMERRVDTARLRAAGVAVGRVTQHVLSPSEHLLTSSSSAEDVPQKMKSRSHHVAWIEDEERRAPIEQEWRSRVDSHLCYTVVHAANGAAAGECRYDVALGTPLRPSRVPVAFAALTRAHPQSGQSSSDGTSRRNQLSTKPPGSKRVEGVDRAPPIATLTEALDHRVKAELHRAIGVSRIDPPTVQQWKEDDAAQSTRFWKLVQARERTLWRSVEHLFEGVVVGQPILHGFAIPASYLSRGTQRSTAAAAACHAALLPCLGAALLAFDALPRIVAAVPGDEFCAEFFPLVAKSQLIRDLRQAHQGRGRETPDGTTARSSTYEDEALLSAVCEALDFPSRSFVIGRWPEEDEELTRVNGEGSSAAELCVLLTAAGVQWMENVRRSSEALVAQRYASYARVAGAAVPSAKEVVAQKVVAPTSQGPTQPKQQSHSPRTRAKGTSLIPGRTSTDDGKPGSGTLRISDGRLGFTPHKRFVDSGTVQTLRTVEEEARLGTLPADAQEQFRWHLDPMVVAERERAAKEKAAQEKFLADPTQPPWRKAALSPMAQHVHLNRTTLKQMERHKTQQVSSMPVGHKEASVPSVAAKQLSVVLDTPQRVVKRNSETTNPMPRKSSTGATPDGATFDVHELRSLITRHL